MPLLPLLKEIELSIFDFACVQYDVTKRTLVRRYTQSILRNLFAYAYYMIQFNSIQIKQGNQHTTYEKDLLCSLCPPNDFEMLTLFSKHSRVRVVSTILILTTKLFHYIELYVLCVVSVPHVCT